jgi:hypothetical protein
MSVRRAAPYRLVAPVIAEDDLHESVASALDVLLMPPAMWTTFPAGSVPLPPQFATKLSRLGLHRGWPDILILHQRVFGVELKRVGGAVSRTRMRVLDGQVDVFPRLVAAGMAIAVCRSVDEVLAALATWQVPLRTSTNSAVVNPPF